MCSSGTNFLCSSVGCSEKRILERFKLPLNFQQIFWVAVVARTSQEICAAEFQYHTYCYRLNKPGNFADVIASQRDDPAVVKVIPVEDGCVAAVAATDLRCFRPWRGGCRC